MQVSLGFNLMKPIMVARRNFLVEVLKKKWNPFGSIQTVIQALSLRCQSKPLTLIVIGCSGLALSQGGYLRTCVPTQKPLLISVFWVL